MQKFLPFNKTKSEHGWLSNMSYFKILYDGQEWPSSEALFQALRFNDKSIRESIRLITNPYMSKELAKELAKTNPYEVIPRTEEDLDNMRLVIHLKCTQHENLQRLLLLTDDSILVEDVTTRSNNDSNNFWGMRLENNNWLGDNWLGKIWMEERTFWKQEKLKIKKSKPLFLI